MIPTKIILDYNNDRVTISTGDRDNKPAIFDKVKNIHLLKQVLEEIFNRLDDSRLSSATPYFGIILDKIDEDANSNIGEW